MKNSRVKFVKTEASKNIPKYKKQKKLRKWLSVYVLKIALERQKLKR